MFLVEMSVVTSSRILTMLASLMTSTLREDFVDDDQLGKVATGGSQWICETTMEVCMPSSKTNIERFLHLVFIRILTSSNPCNDWCNPVVSRSSNLFCVIWGRRWDAVGWQGRKNALFFQILGQFWWPGTVDPSWNQQTGAGIRSWPKPFSRAESKCCQATCLSLYAFIKFALYTRPFLLARRKNGNMVWLHMDYNCAWKPSIPPISQPLLENQERS